jgi:hypothetical protein
MSIEGMCNNTKSIDILRSKAVESTEISPFSTTFREALDDEHCIEPYIAGVDNILVEFSDGRGPAWGVLAQRISYPGSKSPLTDIEIALAKILKEPIVFFELSGYFCGFGPGSCGFGPGICDLLTYLPHFLKEAEAGYVGSHIQLRVVNQCLCLLDHFVDAGLGNVFLIFN